MTRQEFEKLVQGKTIKSIKTSEYIGWVTFEEIVFTDGTVVMVGGNADEAHIDTVQHPDGSLEGVFKDSMRTSSQGY